VALPASAFAIGGRTSLASSQGDPSRIDFGDVGAGTYRTEIATITNSPVLGVGTAVINDWSVGGTDSDAFFPSAGTCSKGQTLNPGQSCTVHVAFSPARVRTYGGDNTRLTVDTDSGSPSIALTGRGSSACDDGNYPASRDKANPLALSPGVHPAGATDPLQGAKFFVDRTKGLAIPDLRNHPSLGKIAYEPENKRFSRYTAGGSPEGARGNTRNFICRVRKDGPGTIPTASVYRIHHDHCGHASDSKGEQGAYRQWIDGFARGIGRQPMVLFYEFDSLITVGCLSSGGLSARIGELQYGLKKLSSLPHTVIYIDAGAADALPYKTAARLLNRVGLGSIQGFFLNSTHYDWTQNEVNYGKKVSGLTHNKHFVVSTSVNGRGPLVPRSKVHGGNEVLCNPPGRGLGIRPTTKTSTSLADGYLWIGNAGLSGGACHPGDVGNGRFFLKYALSLVSHANEQYGPHTKSLPY
jgi:endoglucanase